MKAKLVSSFTVLSLLMTSIPSVCIGQDLHNSKYIVKESVALATSDNQSLESILGGSAPTINLVNEKLDKLTGYTTDRFSDLKRDDWFCSSVSKLVGMGGINGYADGTFKPQNTITTAEFIKILLAAMGYKQETAAGMWYSNYVKKAQNLNVIDSTDNYNYEAGVKRKDIAKMLCRILKIDPSSSSNTAFSDVGSLDTKWIDTAFNEFLIRGYYSNGVRTFKPEGTAIRAEVCEMVVRALEYKNNPKEFKDFNASYNSELERRKDIESSTFAAILLSEDQNRRLKQYPENKAADDKSVTGKYISNIEFTNKYGTKKAQEAVREAKGYLEAFNNLDYRWIDKLSLKDELNKFISDKTVYLQPNGSKITPEVKINSQINFVKQRKVVLKARFITDTSMVYMSDDGKICIKGVLQWCVTSSSGLPDPATKIGQWYEEDKEVVLTGSSNLKESFIKESTLKEKTAISAPAWSK